MLYEPDIKKTKAFTSGHFFVFLSSELKKPFSVYWQSQRE